MCFLMYQNKFIIHFIQKFLSPIFTFNYTDLKFMHSDN